MADPLDPTGGLSRPDPELIPAPRDGLRVVELSTEETYGVRRLVLRADTPTKHVAFPEDDLPGVLHLGVRDGDRIVATSTWVPRRHTAVPDSPAVQLRGMATMTTHQGRGIGARLIEVGCERARSNGAALVWANARDAALAFYRRNGFTVIGEGFVDDATRLPHHLVMRDL
jgi:GNAT superfamily N-acetyltransferase